MQIDLISAIRQTPINIAYEKLKNAGQTVPESLVRAKSLDKGFNLLAYQVLTEVQQAEQTLLDPNNQAESNSNALVSTAQGVSQAYTQAQALSVNRNPVQPTPNPIDITI